MDARNIIVLLTLLLAIAFVSYGVYEFQYVMSFDNAEKVDIYSGRFEYYKWILFNCVLASILVVLLIMFIYPLTLLLKSRINLYYIEFLLAFISFFVCGIIGGGIGL